MTGSRGAASVMALAALALAACAPATDRDAAVSALDADARGVVSADWWPDACNLADAGGVTDPEPTTGTTPDGTPLPGAIACRWSTDGDDVDLRVRIVTRDTEEAWLGYQYSMGLRAPVSGLGDDAFLVPAAGQDQLWVCQGLTIFVLSGPETPPDDPARDHLLAVAAAAVDELQGMPAGDSSLRWDGPAVG